MRTLILCGLFFLLPWTAANGLDSNRRVQGIVEDTVGEPVPDAKVTLRNQASNQTVETTSDEDGHFEFENVPNGQYTVEVEVPGFEAAVVPVVVGTEPLRPITVRLQLAKAKQELTVSAKATNIPSAQQNPNYVGLDQRQLQSLPVKEGDPLAVPSLFLEPAVVGAKGPTIIVDGVESSTLEVPLSSIREISVNKSPYSAEFARPGKGRIEVVTRRGSRHVYRGMLSLLLRNSDFDARNAFAEVRPPLQRAVPEAQLSGPLTEHSTFFIAGRYFINNQTAVINAATPSGLLIENFPTPERDSYAYGRIDFSASHMVRLTLAYKFKDKSKRDQNVGGFNLPARATDVFDRENEFKLFETATVSDDLINELRFTYKNQPTGIDSLVNQPATIVLGAFSDGGAQISQHLREQVTNAQDIVSYVKGRHVIRFGAGARPRFFTASDASNFGGTFLFSSLASFDASKPFLFTLNHGTPLVSFDQYEFFGFFEDEMQLRKNLSLSLGMRQELQTNLKDYNNAAPRLALAWAPGGGMTTIRLGSGIFYDRLPETMVEQSLLYDGERINEIVIPNPSYPVPFSSLIEAATPSVVRIAPGIQAPYVIQSSAAVERKLGSSGRNYLTVEYANLRGVKLYRMRNINAPLPDTGLRPNPNFININQFESSGTSRSNSLTVAFQTSVRPRLDLLAQYVLSKSSDDTNGLLSLPANSYDLRGEFGRSDFDRRHRFTLLSTYRLPRAFKFGAIVNLQSGIPFNITTGLDNNHDTVANDRPPGVGRNAGNGPGYADVDLHLSKDIRFERSRAKPKMEIGVDAFNVFNRVNFKDFVGTMTSPFFGRANAASPARELQLSVKFNF